MKNPLKTMFLVALAIIAMGSIYAKTFEKVELIDAFGDPTGVFYVQATKDFDGTYQNSDGVSNGKLKWNIKAEEKKVTFILKEKGKSNQLSTAVWTTENYDVMVKDSKTGIITTYTGTTTRGEDGVLNCISVSDSDLNDSLALYFLRGADCKIVISNGMGQYNLGFLDASEIASNFYDVDTYKDIMYWFEHWDSAFEDAEQERARQDMKNYIKTLFMDNTDDGRVKNKYILSKIDEFDNKSLEFYWPWLAPVFLETIDELSNVHKMVFKESIDILNEKKYELMDEYPEYSETIRFCLRVAEVYDVGLYGEALGYVFYDCDADNDSGNADGLISSECGWRFLEAAPYDLSYLEEPQEDGSILFIITSEEGERDWFIFGYSNNPNLFVNGEEEYDESNCTSTAIGTGEKNTELLISEMGKAAYTNGVNEENTVLYAANAAEIVSVNGYGDWFLPSRDELGLMYDNLKAKGIGSFSDGNYWSSSEYYDYAGDAWVQDFSNGYQYRNNRYYAYCIRPCRAF